MLLFLIVKNTKGLQIDTSIPFIILCMVLLIYYCITLPSRLEVPSFLRVYHFSKLYFYNQWRAQRYITGV